ncbi:uncharacterized protein NPIL_429641 [Nephila pilipes]|uniref:Shavenoid isoform B-like N-terminal domain-containing protein n=1 Tax=Nephila pilipes TaxID=299642 RepID=A0A8X6TP22_NEPPI|nr:uncharacterized protein NPIL_429641 [Nephila pilipes]
MLLLFILLVTVDGSDVTRDFFGDIFRMRDCHNGSRCDNGGARPALEIPGRPCFCQCAPTHLAYREDKQQCVKDIRECYMSVFYRPFTVEAIPLVYLPTSGQLVHPDAHLSLAGRKNADAGFPSCKASVSQYLTKEGWRTLTRVDGGGPVFGLFTDNNKTFLQFLGNSHDRRVLQQHLALVRLFCKIPQYSPFETCVAIRVGWVPGIDSMEDETPTSKANMMVVGLSLGVLGLVYVFAVVVYLKIRRQQIAKRKNNSDQEACIPKRDDDPDKSPLTLNYYALECYMSVFYRPFTVEAIPLVYLPTSGQLVHPDAHLSLAGRKNADAGFPSCKASVSQYLTKEGWRTLTRVDGGGPVFGLFTDNNKTFLQFLGNSHDRRVLQQHLALVRLFCKIPQYSPFETCVAIRVGWVPGIDSMEDETPTSKANMMVVGLSLGVLGLVYVFAVVVYLKIRRQQIAKRKNNSDQEACIPKRDDDPDKVTTRSGIETSKRLELYHTTSIGRRKIGSDPWSHMSSIVETYNQTWTDRMGQHGCEFRAQDFQLQPEFFEPEFLASPPQQVLEYLERLQSSVTFARHRLRTCYRYQPTLIGIPEDDYFYQELKAASPIKEKRTTPDGGSASSMASLVEIGEEKEEQPKKEAPKIPPRKPQRKTVMAKTQAEINHDALRNSEQEQKEIQNAMNTLNETLDALEYDIYKQDLMHQASDAEHTNPSSREGELDDFDTSSCSSLSAVTVLGRDVKKHIDMNSTGSRSVERNLSEEFSTFRNSTYSVGNVMPGLFAQSKKPEKIERSPDGSEDRFQNKKTEQNINRQHNNVKEASRSSTPSNENTEVKSNISVANLVKSYCESHSTEPSTTSSFESNSVKPKSISAFELNSVQSRSSPSFDSSLAKSGSTSAFESSREKSCAASTSHSTESCNTSEGHSMESRHTSNVCPIDSSSTPTKLSKRSRRVSTESSKSSTPYSLESSNASSSHSAESSSRSCTSPSGDEGKSPTPTKQPNKCHGHKSSDEERQNTPLKRSDKRHLLKKSSSTESMTTISTDMTTDSLESCPSSPNLERSLSPTPSLVDMWINKLIQNSIPYSKSRRKFKKKLVVPENEIDNWEHVCQKHKDPCPMHDLKDAEPNLIDKLAHYSSKTMAGRDVAGYFQSLRQDVLKEHLKSWLISNSQMKKHRKGVSVKYRSKESSHKRPLVPPGHDANSVSEQPQNTTWTSFHKTSNGVINSESKTNGNDHCSMDSTTELIDSLDSHNSKEIPNGTDKNHSTKVS